MQAVLLGEVVETNWNNQGVPAKSRVEVWPLNHPISSEEAEGRRGATALASDGQFLYFHGPFGLLKAGSGYGNTKRVRPSTCGVFSALHGFLWRREGGGRVKHLDSSLHLCLVFLPSLILKPMLY